jgi:hypothetical protein
MRASCSQEVGGLSRSEQQVGNVPGPVAPRPPRRTAGPAAVFGMRTAGDVMDRRPPMVSQDTSLWNAWGRLRGAGCRHLVVVDRQLHPWACSTSASWPCAGHRVRRW